jgi:hypothetical protein
MSKKVIRLTESELIRVIERVIKEQGTAAPGQMKSSLATKIYNNILKAMEGMGTDETAIVNQVKLVTTPQVYKELLNLVKTKQKKNTVMEWIGTEMKHSSGGYGGGRGSVHGGQSNDSSLVGGGDLKQLSECSKILSKFNPNEKVPPAIAQWYDKLISKGPAGLLQ